MKLLNEKITKFDVTQVIYYSMVLIILRVDLIFLDNTPTGGDMGAHVVPIKYFIENFASSSKAKEEIIATYEGEDIIIGYNGEYLKDVINHTTGDEITIKLNTPISATLFVDPNKQKNKIMLLMPVRINS